MYYIFLISLISLLFSFCLVEQQIAFVIIKLQPGTMFQISLQTIIETLSTILFFPYVSAYVASINSEQNKSLLTLLIKNISIIVAFVQLIYNDENSFKNNNLIYTWMFCISVSFIFNNCNKILIEKQWFKLWLNSDPLNNQYLRNQNASFNYVKQFSRILSPILITPIIEIDIQEFAQIMLLIQTILMFVQIIAQMIGIYKLNSYLIGIEYKSQKNLNENENDNHITEPKITSNYSIISFFNDKLFLKMLSLSLLFCSLLDHGQQSVGYLQEHPGVNNQVEWNQILSICKGIAAIMSALGVMIQNFSSNLNVSVLGKQGLSYFFLCLSPILIFSIFLEQYHKEIQKIQFSWTMLIFMTVSRLGLWLFDICIQQTIIDNVDHMNQSVFNGYCESMNQVFLLTMNILTLIFNDSRQFSRFAILSVSNVGLSLGLQIYSS